MMLHKASVYEAFVIAENGDGKLVIDLDKRKAYLYVSDKKIAELNLRTIAESKNAKVKEIYNMITDAKHGIDLRLANNISLDEYELLIKYMRDISSGVRNVLKNFIMPMLHSRNVYLAKDGKEHSVVELDIDDKVYLALSLFEEFLVHMIEDIHYDSEEFLSAIAYVVFSRESTSDIIESLLRSKL